MASSFTGLCQSFCGLLSLCCLRQSSKERQSPSKLFKANQIQGTPIGAKHRPAHPSTAHWDKSIGPGGSYMVVIGYTGLDQDDLGQTRVFMAVIDLYIFYEALPGSYIHCTKQVHVSALVYYCPCAAQESPAKNGRAHQRSLKQNRYWGLLLEQSIAQNIQVQPIGIIAQGMGVVTQL